MPANFDDDVGRDLTLIQRLFENPTNWGQRVINLIDNALGDFGTAALRDTGTGGGNLPAIGDLTREPTSNRLGDNGGLAAFVGRATTENKGLFDGSPGDADSFPRQIQRILNTFQSTIGAGRVNISRPEIRYHGSRRELRFLTTTNRPSLVLVGAGGSPTGIGNAAAPIILLSDSNNNELTQRIGINGGGTNRPIGVHGTPGLHNNSGVLRITPEQLAAFKFQWGFILRGWGAEGGVEEAVDRSTSRADNAPPSVRSEAGDLLVAFKPADTALWYISGDGDANPFLYYGSIVTSFTGKTAFAVEILL